MKDIIIIGGGGHAKVIISLLKKISTYSILGYTDIKDNGLILGVKYLGQDNEVLKYDVKPILALGIGQITNVSFRKSIIDFFKKREFKFETIISPNSVINEEVAIGEGTVVMDGVIINSGANIGKYSIINTKSSVDHDCTIGDFVHIAPGVTICGGVGIGSNTLIGAGTTVLQYKLIGSNSIVGAGSLVSKDVIGYVVVAGIPAKFVKKIIN